MSVDFLTVSEWSKENGICARLGRQLCQEGRVHGAIKKPRLWLIPKGTPLPEHQKRGRPKGSTKKES